MSHADESNNNHPDLTAPNLNWDQWQRTGLRVAAIGWAVFFVAGIADFINQPSPRGPAQFFLSYLFGVAYWLSLPMGSLALLGVLYLTGGKWGVYLRKFFEANTRTLPLLALLFVPMFASVLIGNQSPYWWAAGDNPSHPSVQYSITPPDSQEELSFRFKWFLNPAWYIGLSIIWFVIWYGLIYAMNRWSKEAEANRDPVKRSYLRKIAGPAIIIYAITLTFAFTHWVVSLEVSWASTMFPVIVAINQILSSLALCLAVLLLLANWSPLKEYVRPGEQIHMGSLTLAITLFWTYVSFSQFLLVWVESLPEESAFFYKRSREGWQVACWMLGIFHFAAPFMLLLFRRVKEDPVKLRNVCLMLVGICMVDVWWWIAPSASHVGRYFWWLMDLGALAGVGGLWAWKFLGELRRGPLLPVHEVYLVEEHHHE